MVDHPRLGNGWRWQVPAEAVPSSSSQLQGLCVAGAGEVSEQDQRHHPAALAPALQPGAGGTHRGGNGVEGTVLSPDPPQPQDHRSNLSR